MVKRKQYDSQFKATVALEAAKNQKTIAQIASDYGVHPNQVGQWKKQLLQLLPEVFSNRQTSSEKAKEQLIDELYRQIGQLKVELDWLKKNLGFAIEQKRQLIDLDIRKISISRQCELIGLAKSSFY
jgi:putative transposase